VPTHRMWITWNASMRSRHLAADLRFHLDEFELRIRLLRHPLSFIRTLLVLIVHRPTLVAIQYSYLLLICCLLVKYTFRRPLRIVCDCHTKALRRSLRGPLAPVFTTLKKWSLGRVDLLTVANPHLEQEARKWCPRVLVQPDPIPPIAPACDTGDQVIVPASFERDEPIESVLDAATLMQQTTPLSFVITGRPSRTVRTRRIPPNVTLVGFLPRHEYEMLLRTSALCLALTTEDCCSQSGAQEAMAAGIPVVVSDTAVMRAFFCDAAIYVEPRANAIASGISDALRLRPLLAQRLAALRGVRSREYTECISTLRRHCGELSGESCGELTS
jgi:glycosyltransferase involved in cell wall biosynthesis